MQFTGTNKNHLHPLQVFTTDGYKHMALLHPTLHAWGSPKGTQLLPSKSLHFVGEIKHDFWHEKEVRRGAKVWNRHQGREVYLSRLLGVAVRAFPEGGASLLGRKQPKGRALLVTERQVQLPTDPAQVSASIHR